MDQYMGNLFFRQQSMKEIAQSTYRELRYWNGWHEAMLKEEKKQIEKSKKK
jgi:hypothetical protein